MTQSQTPIERALVTGGAGFIGAHLVRSLLKTGTRVRVLDNFSTGTRENLSDLEGNIEVLEGDIRDELTCKSACNRINIVFHLAAFVSVPLSIQNPQEANAVNLGGTLNMLLAARDAGAERLIFSSSAAIYGDTKEIPTSERAPTNPLSPYGVQKLTGEQYAKIFTSLYALDTVSLRYFNVYGPNQSPDSPYAAVIPRFIQALISGKPPVIYGDGEQTRDFCSVEDVAQANILAASADRERAAGKQFNIGNGTGVSLNHLLEIIKQIYGRSITPDYLQARPGDIRHSRADISAAIEQLGYTPRKPLKEGLLETLNYFREISSF